MLFKSTGKSEVKTLPDSIYHYMRRRFSLSYSYLDSLRCFEFEGRVGEQKVKRIRIFSPCTARRCHISLKTNTDLEQHPGMLLFEGHIDGQGGVYVADRREPATKGKLTNLNFIIERLLNGKETGQSTTEKKL